MSHLGNECVIINPLVPQTSLGLIHYTKVQLSSAQCIIAHLIYIYILEFQLATLAFIRAPFGCLCYWAFGLGTHGKLNPQ